MPKGEWFIDETKGSFVRPAGEPLQGELSFQSILTAPLVIQILRENRCDLPSLAESTAQHNRPLLSSLIMSWNKLWAVMTP